MFAEGPLRNAVMALGAEVEVVPLPGDLAAAGDSRFVRADRRRESLTKPIVEEPRTSNASPPAPLPDGDRPALDPSIHWMARPESSMGVESLLATPSRPSKTQGVPPDTKPDTKPDDLEDVEMGASRLKGTAWHHRFFATKISAVGFFWKLQQTIRRIQPDLIHSNALKGNLCLSAVPLRGCPVLWHIHDFYSHRPKVQRLVRLASRRATACLAISKSIVSDIQSVAPNLAVHLLENGVDTDHFSPGEGDRTALDRAAGFSESSSTVRVGLVATYANWKGHAVFLQAIARLPNVRAVIVGGPIYTTAGSQWSVDELRAKATELGIGDRVGFISFQSDPVWIYRSLDIVVHASTRPEPFGLTIAEAMACGRPVVVSAAGGANDLFTDQHDAIGHESGNVESLAKAIGQLANDANLRQMIGRQARQTAVERFSTTRFGKRLIDIYESVLVGQR